ncbi:MAG TPA: hypothetical protein VMJ30_00720 [Gemmatimonadales bacterium]|nr:hypothetical protein [Gemmatimonadales bacterium]
MSRFGGVLALALSLGTSLAAQGVPGRYEVRLNEADGRLLVSEELAKGNNGLVHLALQPQGNAFQVMNGRITLAATAESSGLVCPVWISGVPMIAGNRLSLKEADVTTEGMLCNGTLTVLKPKALEALLAHPWDLAGRLARASTEPALPGPRLPVAGCLLANQLTLAAVQPRGSTLVVTVAVGQRAGVESCP